MSDTNTNDQWPDRTLTPAQQENRTAAALIPVSRSGALPMDFAQMVDYAKFMSTARGAVGAHLNGNVGGCLAIMELAKQFDMPAYALARQTYLVNGRIAFMGQFVHAIINKYCPLKKKLAWTYKGAGDDLQIIISGEFLDETEPRVYESPKLRDIKVRNSPLWATNPKHQFIYFGVRAWQTVHWPEGLLEIQTDDEAAAMEPLRYIGADNAKDVTERPGEDLKNRLAAHRETVGGEQDGFKNGFTEGHFEDANAAGNKVDATVDSGIAAAQAQPQPPGEAKAAEPDKPAAKATKKATGPKPYKKPKTAAEWKTSMTAHIAASIDAESLKTTWNADLTTRADLGVSTPDRDEVFVLYQDKLAELEGE